MLLIDHAACPPADQRTDYYLMLKPTAEEAVWLHGAGADICARAGTHAGMRPAEVLHVTLLPLRSMFGRPHLTGLNSWTPLSG